MNSTTDNKQNKKLEIFKLFYCSSFVLYLLSCGGIQLSSIVCEVTILSSVTLSNSIVTEIISPSQWVPLYESNPDKS